jgi:hypothetical protein
MYFAQTRKNPCEMKLMDFIAHHDRLPVEVIKISAKASGKKNSVTFGTPVMIFQAELLTPWTRYWVPVYQDGVWR